MDNEDVEVCKAIKAAISTSKPRMSVEKLAEMMAISPNRLAHITQGRTPPRPQEVDAIRSILHLPPNWPYLTEVGDRPEPGERVSLIGTPLVEITVYGNVSAGPGNWRVDPERKKVAVPANLARIAPIGLIVDGDSMMPMLEENDTACFTERRRPKHGFSFLVNIPKEGDRVKIMQFDRGDWYMASLNPKYPRELLPSGSEVIGMLVGIYRVNGTEEIVIANPDGIRPPML